MGFEGFVWGLGFSKGRTESLKPSGEPSIDRVHVRVCPSTTRGPFGLVIVAVIDESSLVSVTAGGNVERGFWALATAGNANGMSDAMATTTSRFIPASYHVGVIERRLCPIRLEV